MLPALPFLFNALVATNVIPFNIALGVEEYRKMEVAMALQSNVMLFTAQTAGITAANRRNHEILITKDMNYHL